MNQPELRDPRYLYKTDGFDKQDQETPALQAKMRPEPDCGEKSYQGHDKLLNRRVLITGGDSGIGRATAIAFAREDADVAIQYLPGEEPDAEAVAELVRAAGRQALLLPCDFKDVDVVTDLVDRTIAEFGGIDTLVLNAGQQISQPSLAKLPIEQVRATFEVNIVAMFALAQAALPKMPAGGSIVTTTSIQAYAPSGHLLDYAATKAAIKNFTINLAAEAAEKGIRVNGVAPGPIWTPLQLDQGQPIEALPKFGQDTLLKRAGQPAELAPVYVFLASNDASYVTAQIYGVTGGGVIN